jgi:hypothetical protein
VDVLVAIDAISDQPFNFWLRDYQNYVAENPDTLQGIPFNETLQCFLGVPIYKYNSSIALDEGGNIIASRTQITFDNLDVKDADQTLRAMTDQWRVSAEQPVNSNGGKWSFFTFNTVYYLWDFLLVTEYELKLTTAIGILSVFLMGLLFLPHWSGAMFVGPILIVLYIDLLGVLEMSGIDINGGECQGLVLVLIVSSQL